MKCASMMLSSFFGLILLAAPARPEIGEVTLEPVVEVPDPVQVTHAGDERLFVVRASGQVMLWNGEELVPEPVLDLSERIANPRLGLFSVAFHPDFDTNRFVFVHRTDAGSFDSVISRFRIAERSPGLFDVGREAVMIRIRKEFKLHFGGQLRFGPDGYLYASTGDTSGADDTGMHAVDPRCASQSLERLEGKLLRLDVDRKVDRKPYYAIPASNPFAGSARPEIWALGLRNPWRFAFDRETGDLWMGDVGEDEREEVNFQPASSPGGENYGWKVMEGTACFGDTTGCGAVPVCNDADLIPPAVEYRHQPGRCAVISGVVYRGSLVPDLYGHFLYGDFCGGTLWATKQVGGRRLTRELGVVLPGLTSFNEDIDGEVYLTAVGGVHKLVDPTLPAAGLVEFSATRLSVMESDAEVVVRVRRVGGSQGAVSVPVALPTESGSASALAYWSDGESGPRTLYLPMPVADNKVDEADREVAFDLGTPEGGAILGARSFARLRIVDDDEPTCVADATHLCLNGGRFRVSVDWRTIQGQSGSGQAVSTGADSGSFWFFSANNPELFVKVLAACFNPFNHYWVFAAGLTSVETHLEVVDTYTGQVRRYDGAPGVAYQAVTDTNAFATCP